MAKRNHKEKGRGIVQFLLVLGVSALAAYGFTCLPWVDLEGIVELEEDFQYNLISTSATIGGFLFTGVSIFISTIDNDRIKRMWDHNYLDNVYRVALLGVVLNVLTILAALSMVVMDLETHIQLWIIRAELVLVLVSLVFFVWNVFDLIFVLFRMKKRAND